MSIEKTRYISTVRKTVNHKTGRDFYYLMNCAGEFVRIRKHEYLERSHNAFGLADIHIRKTPCYTYTEKVLSYYL